MRHPIRLVPILLSLILISCATVNRPPDLPIEGAIAVDGKKIADGIVTASDFVDAGFESGQLTAEQAYKVTKPLNTASLVGADMNHALTIWHDAKTEVEKAEAAEKVKVALKAVRKALDDGFRIVPSDSKVAAQIKFVLGLVLPLMDTFGILPPADELEAWEQEAILLAAVVHAVNFAQILPLLQLFLPLAVSVYREERERAIAKNAAAAKQWPPVEELLAAGQVSWDKAVSVTGERLDKYRAAMGR